MRNICSLLFAVFFLFVINSRTSAQTWKWSSGVTSTSTNFGVVAECYTSSTDELGNTYLTGQLTTGKYRFGQDSVNLVGMAAFITRFDKNGKIKWVRIIKNASGISIAAEHAGTIYVSGDFTVDTIRLGSILLHHDAYMPMKNFYLFKLDSSGNEIWGKSGGACNNDPYKVVAVDDYNNLYFYCSFVTDSITFGSFTLKNSGPFYSRDAFVVKFDPAGNVKWATSFGAGNEEYPFGIAIGRSNDIYLSGQFSSPTLTFASSTVTTSTYFNVFLAKLDSSGNHLWMRAAGYGFNKAGGVAVDSAGSAYMTGEYDSSIVVFDNDTLHNVHKSTGDGFLVKYNKNGDLAWTKNIDGWGYDIGSTVKIERHTQKLWLSGGYMGDTINIDGYHMTELAGGYDNVFLVQYDTSGTMLCSTTIRTGGDDWNGLGFDDSGYLYLGGDYYGDTAIVVGPDTLRLLDDRQEMPFVAKLRPCTLYPKLNPEDPGDPDKSGVHEVGYNGKVALYPNPATSALTAEIEFISDAVVTIGVYNIVGGKLYGVTKHLNAGMQKVDVPVSNLPTGLYIFELRDGQNVVRQKFVKE